MAFDFWNNPLVVSALRVKGRRGELFGSIVSYVAFLGCASVAVWYFAPNVVGRGMSETAKLQLLFVLLLGFQTGVSGLIALAASASSMTQEITSGTLDYQRLTRLTPLQILLGKLLGPPINAYLMAMASIPFAFGIWVLGLPEISLPTLLLLYVNVASTTLMAAAIGLLKSMRGATPQDSNFGVLFIFLFVVPGVIGLAGASFLMRHRLTAALSLFMPGAPLAGLFLYHDPWRYSLSLFGVSIPFLFATPVAQLAVFALCFVFMIRRLTNQMMPPISKPLAYVLLATADLLTAAVLYEPGPTDLSLWPRSTIYWLVHAVACFVLAGWITPDRELLMSWVWRFRGRHSRWRDLWREDRSENLLALLTFCAIGVGVYVLGVAAPAVVVHGWAATAPTELPVILAIVYVCLLTLSLGALYQCCVFAGPAGGLCVLLPVAIELTAFLVGRRYQIEPLLSCSIVAQWLSWEPPTGPLSPAPFLLLYTLIFLVARLSLKSRLRSEQELVDSKLLLMEVRDRGAVC